jgi:alkylation response protein AidB-like acyl-CoA dehydrogenase
MDFSFTESQLALKEMVAEFNKNEIEPIAAYLDKHARFPDDLIKKLADLGLLGMTIPEQYGGTNVDNLSCAIVLEQLAYSGSGVWWLVAFNNSIPEAILHFGTKEQHRKYLPPLCAGSSYASIQFTEDNTGSDPASLNTRAKLEASHYIINGTKRFSTFGARDGYGILYAKDETGNCSSFIIEKNTEGYSVSKDWELMGSGGVEAVDILFENFRVSEQDLLGKKGRGFDVLLYWIAAEKIEQSAAAVGIGQAALDEAIKYASSRTAHGKPILQMQGIRWMLAEMEARIVSARLMTYRAAFLHDKQDEKWISEAATTKIFVIPAMIEVVEMSRRIHGAYGYTKDFKIERLYRAIAGASAIAVGLEINRSIVASSLVNAYRAL